jgi:hypothetical protein
VREGVDLRYDFLREIVDRAGVRPAEKPAAIAARLEPYREEILRGCLRSMVEAARSAGAEVVAVEVPQPGHEALLRERLAIFRPVLEELRVPVLDLLDAFDGAPDLEALRLRAYDHHPTAEGHRLLAERLWDRLAADPDAARALLGRDHLGPEARP